MIKFEQCKMFLSDDLQKLEDEFNLWYRQQIGERRKTPALEQTPLVIFDRVMCVRNYEGEETFVLSIFYEHYDVKATEVGQDRGQNFKGGSAFGPQ